MKLGIVADSHDNMPLIAKAVELFNRENVDLVLHAGDFVSPFTASEFKSLNMKLIGVFGNNDGDKLLLTRRFEGIGELYEDYHEMNLEGKRIVLMHQPKFLEALIDSRKYDLITYGHTHEVDIQGGWSLVINPGECGGWISGKATVAIVDLKIMKAGIFTLFP